MFFIYRKILKKLPLVFLFFRRNFWPPGGRPIWTRRRPDLIWWNWQLFGRQDGRRVHDEIIARESDNQWNKNGGCNDVQNDWWVSKTLQLCRSTATCKSQFHLGGNSRCHFEITFCCPFNDKEFTHKPVIVRGPRCGMLQTWSLAATSFGLWVARPLIGTSDSRPDATGRFIPFQSWTANWPLDWLGPLSTPRSSRRWRPTVRSLSIVAPLFILFVLLSLQWPQIHFTNQFILNLKFK